MNPATPTISNFSIPTKTFGESPFTITQPTSNSLGSFSYTSSNLSVATISGNTIIIVGSGSSTITATQEATSNYTSGIITTNFQVNPAIPTNPVIINSTISSCPVLQLSNMSMMKRYIHGLKKNECASSSNVQTCVAFNLCGCGSTSCAKTTSDISYMSPQN